MAYTPVSHADRRAAQRRAWRHPGGPSLRVLPDALQKKATDIGKQTPVPGPYSIPQTQFSQDPNSIVTVQVQTIQAPTPNTYQQTGCLVSFGASILATQDAAEIMQYSDITSILIAAQPVASVAWAAGKVTVTTTSPLVPNFAPGDTPIMTITGFVPAAYNYTGPATIVDTGTFTYPLVADPGAPTTVGTYQPQSSIELSQMATTFFDQGNMVSVWVLELGYGATIAANAAALQQWLNVNPKTFCGYLLPRVTAYPTKNNAPLLSQFKTDFTNYVATGAEGGISYDICYEGVTKDGNDYFNWWWTIDWVQININLNLSNAIINGSNNPFAPLYYNQDGINFLETNLYNTMLSASALGMVLGAITMTTYNQPDLQNNILLGVFEGMCDVNAVQFIDYVNANPGHYKIGEYDGLSVLFIPARGFIHILVQVTATNLVTI